MTDLPVLFPIVSASGQTVSDVIKDKPDDIVSFFTMLGKAYLEFCSWIAITERKALQDHLRGERLAAYRTRHRWKKSDIQPLLSIGVSKNAERRISNLKGIGRPIVKKHCSLEEVLSVKLSNCLKLFREDTTPSERRRLFKVWPWWKHYVEALYRGERELAREKRVKGPHDSAERAVADALRMSQGKVRAICGEIRAMRLEDAGAANFSPMTLVQYETWMEKGERPAREGIRFI